MPTPAGRTNSISACCNPSGVPPVSWSEDGEADAPELRRRRGDVRALILVGHRLAAVAKHAAGVPIGAPFSGAARARGAAGPEPPILTVTGSGQVSVAPEVATVRFGVEKRRRARRRRASRTPLDARGGEAAAGAEEAPGAVSVTTDRVGAALQAFALPEAAIQTQSLNAFPAPEQPAPSGRRRRLPAEPAASARSRSRARSRRGLRTRPKNARMRLFESSAQAGPAR
jgi:hypothetical protein